MPVIMWVLLLLIIFQRLYELVVAKRNERWMKEQGGIESGQEHYRWFVIVHALFFVSILVEVLVIGRAITVNYFLLALFFLLQAARVWCIASLGKFWNTKIIILPEASLVMKGPYKFISHPNYVIVGIELFVIPLLFGAIITAIIFPLLHILLLTVRIPAEERALENLAK